MDKVCFYDVRLTGCNPALMASPLPHYLTTTSRNSSRVVGIPLSDALKPPATYSDVAKQVLRIRCPVETLPTNTVPAMWASFAFVLSRLGYVLHGSFRIPPPMTRNPLGHVFHSIRIWVKI